MEIRRITSFSVDHDALVPGFYISRVDGDTTTYDLRTRTPNKGDYMSNQTMHSVEHMCATFLRNGPMKNDILYFGPMGCQTGFYLLVQDQAPEAVFTEVKRVLDEILRYDGPVFGASAKECGNYRNLDLAAAKAECRMYRTVLEQFDGTDFSYPKGDNI